jgi:uncharacterized protein involved in exopolysaccharide biosynthesis
MTDEETARQSYLASPIHIAALEARIAALKGEKALSPTKAVELGRLQRELQEAKR